MGFRISTNIAALSAHASATMNNRGLDSSLNKLNSGFRITCAADDASGMAIADSLRSQANALGQAIMNANDAIGVIQTADKAMDEQLKILDTIKTKAIQAAQDTQTTETRRALQADINRLMEQLDNIGNTTSFNGQKLLSGAFSNKEFQIGAYSNETIKASIGPTTSDKIGLTRFETGHNIRFDDIIGNDPESPSDGKLTLTFKNVDGINDIALEPVRFAEIEPGEKEGDAPKIKLKAGHGLGALVEAINKASDATGIRASANVKSVFPHVISQGSTTDDFSVNGVTIGKIAVQDKDANGALRAAINRVKDQTGVEASVDNRGRLVLSNRDGRGIMVTDGALPKAGPRPDAPVKRPSNSAEATTAIENLLPSTTAPSDVELNPGVQLANLNPNGAMNISGGKMQLAKALAPSAANKNNLKTIADNIEKTSLQKTAQHNAAAAMLEVLKDAAASSGRSIDAEQMARSGRFSVNRLDISALAFADNTDLMGNDLFGADADAVGNLDGIRSAKNLQAMSTQIRSGMLQLDKNIALMRADLHDIGSDERASRAAARMAVMIDRRAQLEGFLDGVNQTAKAWGITLVNTQAEPKGVEVVKNDIYIGLGDKFAFKNPAGKTVAAVGEQIPEGEELPAWAPHRPTAEELAAAKKLADKARAKKEATVPELALNDSHGSPFVDTSHSGKPMAIKNGKIDVGAALKHEASNNFTPKLIKAELEKTNIAEVAKKTAKNEMLDYLADLISNPGNNGELPKMDNIHLNDFEFKDYLDYGVLKAAPASGGLDAQLSTSKLFGGFLQELGVGNLESAAMKTTFKDIYEAMSDGIKGLEDSLQLMENEASLKINADADNAIRALQFTALIDRKAQMEGWCEGLVAVAKEWGQEVDEQYEPTAAGLRLVAKDGGSMLKDSFELSAASSKPADRPGNVASSGQINQVGMDNIGNIRSVREGEYQAPNLSSDDTLNTKALGADSYTKLGALKTGFETAISKYKGDKTTKDALSLAGQAYATGIKTLKDELLKDELDAVTEKVQLWSNNSTGVADKLSALQTAALTNISGEKFLTKDFDSANGMTPDVLVKAAKNLKTYYTTTGQTKWANFKTENGKQGNGAELTAALEKLANAAEKITDPSKITTANAAAWADFIAAANALDDAHIKDPVKDSGTTESGEMSKSTFTTALQGSDPKLSSVDWTKFSTAIKALISDAKKEAQTGTDFQLGSFFKDYAKLDANVNLANNLSVSLTKTDVNYGVVTPGSKDETQAASWETLEANTVQRLKGTSDTAPQPAAIVKAIKDMDAAGRKYSPHAKLAYEGHAPKTAPAGVADGFDTAGELTLEQKLNQLLFDENQIAEALAKLSPAVTATELGISLDAKPPVKDAPASSSSPDAPSAAQTPSKDEHPVVPGSAEDLASNSNIPAISSEVAAAPFGSAGLTGAGLAAATAALSDAVSDFTATDGATNENHTQLAQSAQKLQQGINLMAKKITEEADAAVSQKAAASAAASWGEEALSAAAGAVSGALTKQYDADNEGSAKLKVGDIIAKAKALNTVIEKHSREMSEEQLVNALPAAFKEKIAAIAALDGKKIDKATAADVAKQMSEAFSGASVLGLDLSQNKDAKNALGAIVGSTGDDWDKFATAASKISEDMAKDSAESIGKLTANVATVAKMAKALKIDAKEGTIGGQPAATYDKLALSDNELAAAGAAAKALNGDAELTHKLPTTKSALASDLQPFATSVAERAQIAELIKNPSSAKAPAAGFNYDSAGLLEQANALMHTQNQIPEMLRPTGYTPGQLGADKDHIGKLPPGEQPAKLPMPLDTEDFADVSDAAQPAEPLAPTSDAGDEVLGLLDEVEHVDADIEGLTVMNFGTEQAPLKPKAGENGEMIDLRGVIGVEGSKATEKSLLKALKDAHVPEAIEANAQEFMIKALANAMGDNYDGIIEPMADLKFVHNIGGAWKHAALPETITGAAHIDDLRDALEDLREELTGFARVEDEKAAQAAAAAAAAGGVQGNRSVKAPDEEAVDETLPPKNPNELTDKASKTVLNHARKALEKLDAVAQIDGWLKAIDGVAMKLEDIRIDREQNGRSMADIIGLNKENSVNFGRLSLVGQNAKDIQLEVRDAGGRLMNSAAGYDRDVQEMTVSLRETNAKTERNVAAAQGFNSEDWMDGELNDENKNGYPAGVMTFKGAQAMIDIAETAQKALEAIRADLGSVQNQLVVTINNISVTQVNVKAAESHIRDVDFAQESATFSKHQILAQSGVYAMSQANAVQQNVMKLLQ